MERQRISTGAAEMVKRKRIKLSRGKGEGSGLMLMVPAETLRSLKVRAAEKSTTVRALVLEALGKAGHPVPASEIGDRRRKG